MLVQEGAFYAVKICNGDVRKAFPEFISASTAFVASPHHHLATSARSSPHLAFSGAATYVHQTQLRASSSAFCACVLTFPVDLEPLVRCVNGLRCVDRLRFSQVRVLQWTSRSGRMRRREVACREPGVADLLRSFSFTSPSCSARRHTHKLTHTAPLPRSRPETKQKWHTQPNERQIGSRTRTQ